MNYGSHAGVPTAVVRLPVDGQLVLPDYHPVCGASGRRPLETGTQHEGPVADCPVSFVV